MKESKKKLFKLDKIIGYQVYQKSLTLKALLDRAYRKAGYTFTSDQSLVLFRLGEEEGISQKQLADRTLKDKPNMTRIIDHLEKIKLLQRRPDPKDRRSNQIYLTPRGRRIREDMIDIVVSLKNKNQASFTKKDGEKLINLLDKLISNYQNTTQ